jgi:hypothetical protein
MISMPSDPPPKLVSMAINIETRITKLANLISLELANPLSTKRTVQANIDRLLRLGLGEQARDIFLSARSANIQHRIR